MNAIFDCGETSIQSFPAISSTDLRSPAVTDSPFQHLTHSRHSNAPHTPKYHISNITGNQIPARSSSTETDTEQSDPGAEHPLPVLTTGQLFLHSCRHFLGLHLSAFTIAIRVNRSDILPVYLPACSHNQKCTTHHTAKPLPLSSRILPRRMHKTVECG